MKLDLREGSSPDALVPLRGKCDQIALVRVAINRERTLELVDDPVERNSAQMIAMQLDHRVSRSV